MSKGKTKAELIAELEQTKNDLLIVKDRLMRAEEEVTLARKQINEQALELGDTRRLAATTSFLSQELAGQVAVQRSFLGVMDRATQALTEKNLRRAKALVRPASQGNPFGTLVTPEIKAEATKLLEEHNAQSDT